MNITITAPSTVAPNLTRVIKTQAAMTRALYNLIEAADKIRMKDGYSEARAEFPHIIDFLRSDAITRHAKYFYDHKLADTPLYEEPSYYEDFAYLRGEKMTRDEANQLGEAGYDLLVELELFADIEEDDIRNEVSNWIYNTLANIVDSVDETVDEWIITGYSAGPLVSVIELRQEEDTALYGMMAIKEVNDLFKAVDPSIGLNGVRDLLATAEGIAERYWDLA